MKNLVVWREYIFDFLKKHINPKMFVLDIGVGTSTNQLRSIGCVVEAAEPCKEIQSTYKYDLCEEVPLELLCKFDAVVCCDMLEHCKQPWVAVKNLSQLIKKNGIVVVTIPSLGLPWHPAPPLYGDYWRVLPGFVEHLFDQHSYLKVVDEQWLHLNNEDVGVCLLLKDDDPLSIFLT